MNEHFKEDKEESFSEVAADEMDVIALLKRMQQQLTFLEKKVDTLIKQSTDRPSFQDRGFSRPHRSFDRPHSRPRRDYGNGPREGNFGDRRPFESREGGENRQGQGGHGFEHKKKPFFHGKKKGRKNFFNRDRH